MAGQKLFDEFTVLPAGGIKSVADSLVEKIVSGMTGNPLTETEALASELGCRLDTYEPDTIVAEYKTGIRPELFESIDEYNDFIDHLKRYCDNYKIVLDSSDEKSRSEAKGNALASIKYLKDTYSVQFEKLVLLHISLESTSPDNIKYSLKYLDSKDVYVERYGHNYKGFVHIDILTTTEVDFKFLKLSLEKRGINGNELRAHTYTPEELDILDNESIKGLLCQLTAEDIVCCVKDDKYLSALIFNMQSVKGENSEEEICKSWYKIIQYVDVTKLRLILLYRAIENWNLDNSFENDDEHLEIINGILKGIRKFKSKPTSFSLRTVNVNVVDIDGIKFEEHVSSDKRESKIVLSEDSVFNRETINISVNLDLIAGDSHKNEFSSEEIEKKCEELIKTIKLKKALLRFEVEGKATFIDFYFGKSANLLQLKSLIKERIKELYPDINEEEAKIKQTEYEIKLLSYLYQYKYMNIGNIIMFDETIACEMVKVEKILISDEDLSKFSIEGRKSICRKQVQRIPYCLENGLLGKSELLSEEHVSIEVVLKLFEHGDIDVEEIAKLVVNKKISLDELNQVKLSQDLLLEQLSAERLGNLYRDIHLKKVEYENAVRDLISQKEKEGIGEECVELGEKEEKLKKELEDLIQYKDAYLMLLRKAELEKDKKAKFLHDVTDIVFSNLEYEDFCQATREMYKDGIIDIDFIMNERLEEVIIELIKASIITPEDIKKYKDSLLSEEDKTQLKDACDSDEEYNDLITSEQFRILEPVLKAIIEDETLDVCNKFIIIYNICHDRGTELEKKFIGLYRDAAVRGSVEDFYKILRELYANAKIKEEKKAISEDEKKKDSTDNSADSENLETSKKLANEYVYPEMVIIEFLKFLDPNVIIEGLSDGNVKFYSSKLNKVVVEKMWVVYGKNVKRAYGVKTLVVDADKFNVNESDIVLPSKKGYRIDVFELKKILPIREKDGKEQRRGQVIHYKDLDNTRKKIYFHYLLEELGIDLQVIRNGKDSRYTPEDADKIEAYIESVRDTHEKV